jgi:hypothetical protein
MKKLGSIRLKISSLPLEVDAILYSSDETNVKLSPRIEDEGTIRGEIDDEYLVKMIEEIDQRRIREIPDDYFGGY